MANNVIRKHPFISNKFPEYGVMSLRSKALLNLTRVSEVMGFSSLTTAAVGLQIAINGALTQNTHVEAVGNNMVEHGIKGLAVSCAVGAVSLIGTVESINDDEHKLESATSP